MNMAQKSKGPNKRGKDTNRRRNSANRRYDPEVF
jgi:hypothetical protein